ncbi:hypothetical protein HDU97_003260 [Phlyctochytrium planicorne]|nr:hypothetical protein HDU97_003260 [Phlyctochytrium planicorne]
MDDEKAIPLEEYLVRRRIPRKEDRKDKELEESGGRGRRSRRNSGSGARAEGEEEEAQVPIPPTILVVGSEGFGVRPAVSRRCDVHVYIEGAGVMEGVYGGGSGPVQEDEQLEEPESEEGKPKGGGHISKDSSLGDGLGEQYEEGLQHGEVESLNVSVATGILLHSLLKF